MATRGELAQAGGTSGQVPRPAPVGGWNTRDAPGAMDVADALILDNLFPGVGRLTLRGGYEGFISSGIGSDLVETLEAFIVGAVEHFVCGTNAAVYEIGSGTASKISGAHVITRDRWITTVFADSATPNAPTMIAVNGADTPWTYDGTTFAAWAPTGPTPASLAWVATFKNRVYAGELNSRDFWYGTLGDLPGAMTRFPLSGIRGAQGNLLGMAQWTRDAGDGADDFAVFLTDEGQAIIYQGTDPGDATAWALVGVYRIPRPMSRQAWVNIFDDVLIQTEADYVLLSEAIQRRGLITASKLVGAMAEAAADYRSLEGWELKIHPRGSKVIGNVPIAAGSQYDQHVLNTQTRAAARFTGWNFATFGIFGGNLYGGGVGVVKRVDRGLADDSDGTPTAIKVRVLPAWDDLRTAGNKQVSAVRHSFRVSEPVLFKPGLALGRDFTDAAAPITVSVGSTPSAPEWDQVFWDVEYWETEASAQTLRAWRTLGGTGSHFAVAFSADLINFKLEWLAVDYLAEPLEGI